ncbi:MAG: type II toxin-antitoxin system VapC family toxin [Alphaproteobacteria bacterium]|nr:type II toxin-antitoxin system VapC family toxin [Alphaproteobacteria bacterium]
MTARLLLDTCAVIWAANGDPLSASSKAAINAAEGVLISPISTWEIGLLFSRGRLSAALAVRPWLDRVLGQPGVELTELSVDVLLDSSFLPGSPPNDPADRIIISTARQFGLKIVTRDRQILAYADSGHVHALAC